MFFKCKLHSKNNCCSFIASISNDVFMVLVLTPYIDDDDV